MTSTATTDFFVRDDLVKILQALWGEEDYRPNGPRFYSNSSDSAGVMLWVDTGVEVTQVLVEITHCHKRGICWINMGAKGKTLTFSKAMRDPSLWEFQATLPEVLGGLVKYGSVIDRGYDALVAAVRSAQGVTFERDEPAVRKGAEFQQSGPRPVTKADVAAAKKTRRKRK